MKHVLPVFCNPIRGVVVLLEPNESENGHIYDKISICTPGLGSWKMCKYEASGMSCNMSYKYNHDCKKTVPVRGIEPRPPLDPV